ncbi:class I SAM-dependent DNA methyltransferase, partial [Gordonia sp. (in: high G+C Gram-positive bacteria)]|uniref:HsdM family class I SAM-dependent methyltransferase n=1 Tax=Gordonia sp. (in: high G+C Gram-positive bacteria) TaxID=84139 RepID=UPI0026195A34
MKDRGPHPALRTILNDTTEVSYSDLDYEIAGRESTTSDSLARLLTIGCLSRLDPDRTSVDIWDPAAGIGYAGFLIADALQSVGVQVKYRGQDINEQAVSACQRRFAEVSDAKVNLGDTLAHDTFPDFEADLVIVDAPFGLSWETSADAIETRRESGAFHFGLPRVSDGTWLFISLALEKLRPAEQGGGRVAALVAPAALSSVDGAAIRERIVEAGLLESVTRLPAALAPNTQITLYLLTFTNRSPSSGRGKVAVADMQTQYTTERRHRSMTPISFKELESGLRTGKPGKRNRVIDVQQLIRRSAELSRTTPEGLRFSWRIDTYNDTPIDDSLLKLRYSDLDPRVVVGVPAFEKTK